jgi:hypothetical protein
MSKELPTSPDIDEHFDPKYWGPVDQAYSPAESVAVDNEPGPEAVSQNPEFCLTCPFNAGRTEGPVEGRAGFASDEVNDWVIYSWTDEHGNTTPTIKINYAGDYIGSDQMWDADRTLNRNLRNCNLPLGALERRLAWLFMERAVKYCSVTHVKNSDGTVSRRRGVYIHRP